MSNPNSHSEHSLVETVPASLVSSSWKTFCITIGSPTALFCLWITVSAGLLSGWEAALLLSLIFWSWGAFLLIGLTVALHQKLKMQIPTVELRAGVLTVRYGSRMLTAKVTECHLHWGRAHSMKLVGGPKLYSWVPVILIDFPPYWYTLIGLRCPRNIVAVGYSNEMRDKWEKALLAAVNHTPCPKPHTDSPS